MGFASFLQICLCQNVLQLYARKLCCMFWSSMEGKSTDSAFGNCSIHLMIEIDMVIFEYDCSCEWKGWLSSESWDFSMLFFLYIPKTCTWKVTIHVKYFCTILLGLLMDSYEFKTIMHRENENLFYNLSIWAVVVFFRMSCVCVSPNRNEIQKMRTY